MKVYNRTCFLYDCPNGCKLKSSEAYVYTDENVITYKIEEEDLPPAYPERIIDTFCEVPLSQVYPSTAIAHLIS
jgi:hypothetical protein